MKKFDLKKGLTVFLLIITAVMYSQTANTIRLTSSGSTVAPVPDEGTSLFQDDTTLSIDAAGAVTVNALDPDYTLGSNTGVVTFADALNKTFNIRLKGAQVIDQTPGSTYGAITTAGGIDRASDGAIGVRPSSGTLNFGIENGEGITFGFATPNLPTSVTLQITRIYFSTFGAAESGVIVNRRDTSKKIEFVGPATGTNIIIDVDSLDLNVRGGSTLFEMASIFNNSSTVQSWRVTQIEFKLVETNSLTTVWNGTTWSAFNPSPTMNAVIAGNYSAFATGGFSAKSLTINSGTLAIEATKAVKVDNEIINNAGPTGIVVYSGGGLRQVNNTVNTGAITIKRDTSPLSRLDSKAWSSPIANQNLQSFSPATLSSNFLNYDETTNQFSAVASPSTTDFAAASGYLIGMPDNAVSAPSTQIFEGNFIGITNNGDITKAVTYGGTGSLGYNLIGNPYPSTVIANSFINANIANIDGSIYFYRKSSSTSGSAYAMYSRLGATNLVANSTETNAEIPVGEGFIVKAKNNADLIFTNAMRIASVPATLTADRVWLNLTNASGAFSQALVGYVVDGTLGVDNYDGKYINDSPVALTSNLNNEEYTIQGRPAFDASDEVNLNFKTDQAGSYTIGLDHFDGVFATGQGVYLKDNSNGTVNDLKVGPYTFTATAGTDNSRFVLRYRAASYPIAATAGANGSVSGAGTYNTYSTATLIATPASGYGLVNWTEDGVQVSANPTYTFPVTGARTLVANFGFTNVTDVTACTSYNWNGTEYTTSGVYIGDTIEGVVQKLNLTILPLTTSSEIVSACGSSYTWAVNGQTYNASGSYDYVVGCNTATLNLTLTPATNNTTTVSSFLTYTWANNGQTYTTSGIKTGTTTACVTELLDLTIITTQIPTSPYAVCTGATVGSATAGTTLKFYKDTKTTTAAYAGTQKLAAATYYVTEMINSVETARVPVTVTLAALFAPTTIASTEAKVICKYIGTSNPVTFTATATGATSYTWTKPTGATFVGDATGASVQISFLGVAPSVIGTIGSVSVDAKNDLGCPSLKPKVLALSTKAPSAAKGIAFTYNSVVIKKAGNFVGDASKILTLTATDISGTAHHHVWTLPEGTTVVSGDEDKDLVLTIHLGNVEAAITPLVFSVASVGGCGSSTKTLSVARAAAGTPKGIILTDGSSSTPTTAIKKLDSYTGSLKTRTLTLTATPNLSAGSEATSYKWVLPPAATIVDDSATPVEGELNTYTSLSNVISINMANVNAIVPETSFLFKVYGVNGNGRSLTSKDLTATSAAPKAPAAIYAGNTGSGIKYTTYNTTCSTGTISVPAVMGVNNNLELIDAANGVTLSHTADSNLATIVVSGATGSVLEKTFITIRATASTATGTVYKDYVVKFSTTCAGGRIVAEEVIAVDEFNVIAYPNPSSSEFTLDVQSSRKGATGVQVYDMAGRLIENRQVNSNSVEIGRNYASGVYNVIVNKGAQVKTLRVIKK